MMLVPSRKTLVGRQSSEHLVVPQETIATFCPPVH
jgi:hypothetical protein